MCVDGKLDSSWAGFLRIRYTASATEGYSPSAEGWPLVAGQRQVRQVGRSAPGSAWSAHLILATLDMPADDPGRNVVLATPSQPPRTLFPAVRALFSAEWWFLGTWSIVLAVIHS
jgi:hypothetical protein